KVPVTAQTPIWSASGQPVAPRTLKSGDGVLVLYAVQGVARIVINPKPAELTAFIKSVGGDMRSLLVTEVGTNANYKVVVTPETEVVNSQGKSLEMKDLHTGDGVGIAYTKGVASKIVVAPTPAR